MWTHTNQTPTDKTKKKKGSHFHHMCGCCLSIFFCSQCFFSSFYLRCCWGFIFFGYVDQKKLSIKFVDLCGLIRRAKYCLLIGCFAFIIKIHCYPVLFPIAACSFILFIWIFLVCIVFFFHFSSFNVEFDSPAYFGNNTFTFCGSMGASVILKKNNMPTSVVQFLVPNT